METVCPAHLYKFRSLQGSARDRTFNILAESELFWANPSTFNDPFDCAPVMTIGLKGEELERYLFDGIRRNNPELLAGDALEHARKAIADPLTISAAMQKTQAHLRNSPGVCSFSEKDDNILMWSHYADEHRGLCIEFTSSMPWPLFSIAGSEPYSFAHKVSYELVRPVIDTANIDRSATDKMLLTKADDWDYEKEWRMIDTRGQGLRKFDPTAITAVLLGAKMGKADLLAVKAWVAQLPHKPELHQMALDDQTFRVVRQPAE